MADRAACRIRGNFSKSNLGDHRLMPPQSLRFRDDGTFTIGQFPGLHWHDGTGDDVCTRSLMEMVLDTTRPDFVVLKGDVTERRSGRSQFRPTVS